MSPDEQVVKIDSESHTIQLRPVTIVCPSADVGRIEYPGCVELDAIVTTYHAERVQRLHAKFEECWRHFMAGTKSEVDYPVTADRIRQMGSGAVHLMGLIDLTLKFLDAAVRVVWKFPESFLHPAWQVGLADLAIYFSTPDARAGRPIASAETGTGNSRPRNTPSTRPSAARSGFCTG